MSFIDGIANETGVRPVAASSIKARLVMSGLAVAASALLGTAATQATAAVADCKPTVTVTNEKGASIKVLNFKYKIEGSPEVFTEGLGNRVVDANGGFESWPSQALRHAAKGVKVTSTAVEFRDDTGRGYGSPHVSDWFPHTFLCGDNHHYNQTVD